MGLLPLAAALVLASASAPRPAPPRLFQGKVVYIDLKHGFLVVAPPGPSQVPAGTLFELRDPDGACRGVRLRFEKRIGGHESLLKLLVVDGDPAHARLEDLAWTRGR